MKSSRQMTINNFLIATLTLFASSSFACNVPVCDIPATLAKLEKGSVDTRATYLGDLYQKTKSLNNVETLKNLHDFSAQSYELQKRLQDPENVLAWSIFLRENSIYGLLKFAPFENDFMKELYDESFKISDLSLDRQLRIRFDSFQRWRSQINNIMDVQYIYNLYSFIYFAKQESEVNKDEDYVIREGNAILDLLGKRLSYLYPSYEGVYSVKTTCSPTPTACGSIDLSADRIVFLNSLSDMGIYTTVYSSKETTLNYMFSKTVIESFGTKLYSLSDSLATTGRPSEVMASLSNQQDIKGNVLSSRYAGTLHFEGKIIYSPIQFYIDEGLKDQKPMITGKFVGTIGDKIVSMIIRQKKGKSLMATVFYGDTLLVDYPTGEYVEHRGIINLVGLTPQKQEPFKINMAYRADKNGTYRWAGGYFNAAGKFEAVEMKRASDIDIPTEEQLLKSRLH